MELLSILLTVVFIALKITNQVDWSWLWVISPMVIYYGFLFLAYIFILIVPRPK